MSKLLMGSVFAMLAVGPALAVVIDFSNPPSYSSPIVYPDATFSGGGVEGGSFCYISKDGCGFGPVAVSFTAPVSDLTFLARNLRTARTLSLQLSTSSGGSFNLDVSGPGQYDQLIDLSGYTGVTNLQFLSTNNDHIIRYDDFSFTVAGGAVPEPAAWAMLIAGFGLTGAMLRRRRAARGALA